MNHHIFQTLAFAIALIAYAFLYWRVIARNRLSRQLLPGFDTRSVRALSLVYWLSPIFFLALWGIISAVSAGYTRTIPTPVDVVLSFIGLLSTGELLIEALISFSRVAIGFILASLVGVSLGLLAGSFLIVNHLVTPLNSFLRYIPPTAFISLLIVYFGVGEPYKYAVIFLGVIFFIIQMVIDVVDDLDMRYVEIGLTNSYSNWDIFKKVIVPFAWPRILDVLRINLSAAWTFLVAAEIIGAQSGLGHLIAVSQRFLRIGDLYAAILTFGVIGLTTDKLLESVSRRLFRWYYVELRR